MATIAITGITGLAGSSVARALRGAGQAVVGITRRSDTASCGADLRTVRDLRDADALAAALHGCDMVLHFADRANRKSYNECDVDTAATVMTALRIACNRTRINRIVAISSVYAEREDRSSDRYVRSKRAMEAVALAPSPGARAMVFRLPPLHGPGAKGAVRHIAAAVRRGWPLPLGLANAPRRFLSLDALAQLCVRLAMLDDLRFDAATGAIWYPSNSDEASLAALARSLGKAKLIPVPGIDSLLSGTVSAGQLIDEQDALHRATGWRAATRSVSTQG